MAVIETKYSVGDKVWYASTVTEAKKHPCPDCLGTGKWTATSPVGTEYQFGCPRCNTFFTSRDDLSLTYTAHVPITRLLTVGSVKYNSHIGSYDSGARYMCVETGVGGGSVYDENRLFRTEEKALARATLLATENNKQAWIAKRYDKALEISDYQLDSAAMRVANQALSHAKSFLWNIHDLFNLIEEAADKDEIDEAVEEYKGRTWDRDKEDVRQALAATRGEAI